jgi:hypothetical protein
MGVAALRDLLGISGGGPLSLLQEGGETFRDRLFDGAVLGLEPLPNCQQPRRSGQDVLALFGRWQTPFRYEGCPT